MARLIVLTLCFSFLVGNSFSQVPSSTNIPPELYNNYNEDVYELAVKYCNEYLPFPYSYQIEIPQTIVDDIWEAMASVYNAYAIPERDTVFDIQCIHHVDEYYYEGTHSFIIDCHPSVFNGNWQNYVQVTGNPIADSLLLYNGFFINDVFTSTYLPNNMLVEFRTNQFVNIWAFTNQFWAAIGGFSNSSLYQINSNVSWIMPEVSISYFADSQGKWLVFEDRWGDCYNGCIYFRDYVFLVDHDNKVWFKGNNPNNDPNPPPNWFGNCNISQAPPFSVDTIHYCDSNFIQQQWIQNDTCIVLDTLSAPSGGYQLSYKVFIPGGNSIPVFQNETICSGNYFVFNSDTLIDAGIYTDTIIAIGSGCDSVVILNLSVSPMIEKYLNFSLCDGEELIFNQDTFSTPGIHVDTLFTPLGICDTVFLLDLQYVPEYQFMVYDSICYGDTLVFDGNSFADPGIYTLNYSSVYGCDSIVLLNLAVKPVSDTLVNVSACNEYFIPNGQVLTQSGIYSFSLSGTNGCDSSVTLDLTLFPSDTTIQIETACDSFLNSDGYYLYQSGIYSSSYLNSFGCDSLVDLYLTVNNSDFVQYQVYTCDSFVLDPSQVYFQSGTYFQYLVNTTGCDSINQIDLTVYHSFDTLYSVNSCNSFTGPDGLEYFTSGTYVFPFQSMFGCDSSITINLSILPEYEQITADTICKGDLYYWQGNSYTQAGTYFDSLVTQLGCDSIVQLNLSVKEIDVQVSYLNDSTLVASNGSADSYQWLNCQSNFSPLTGQNSPVFVANANGEYAVEITSGTCIDTSSCYQLVWLTANRIHPGDYKIWPNPVLHSLYIEALQGNEQLKIYDISGHLFNSWKMESGNYLDLSKLETGFYVLEIRQNMQSSYFRFIKL